MAAGSGGTGGLTATLLDKCVAATVKTITQIIIYVYELQFNNSYH
jgi:hypothetical protein